MTIRRFYCPRLAEPGTSVTLPPDESRHLTRVLRLRAGARVRVFDGRGREHDAVVERDDPRRVVVRLGAARPTAAEPRVRLSLAVTVLKSRKLDGVIRDATALGAAAVVPLLSERAQAGPTAPGGRISERWRGVAVAAAKQCGRAVVPEIRDPVAWRDYVREPAEDTLRLLLVEPAAAPADGGAVGRSAARVASPEVLRGAPPPKHAVIAVGPEGGWTRGEAEAAREHGFHPLTLGDRTLRADLAPVVALAVLQFVWGDL